MSDFCLACRGAARLRAAQQMAECQGSESGTASNQHVAPGEEKFAVHEAGASWRARSGKLLWIVHHFQST
jgi:hypothetical protein